MDLAEELFRRPASVVVLGKGWPGSLFGLKCPSAKYHVRYATDLGKFLFDKGSGLLILF